MEFAGQFFLPVIERDSAKRVPGSVCNVAEVLGLDTEDKNRYQVCGLRNRLN